MKKVISIIMALSIVICSMVAINGSEKTIDVIIDGKRIENETVVRVIEGVVYVSMIPLCEELGAEVIDISSGSKEAYQIKKDKIGRVIELERRNKAVKVNGITKRIDFEPFGTFTDHDSGKSEVVVPLAFIVEQLGGEVIWNAEYSGVIVNSYKPVVFQDENLETEIRSLLRLPEGDIFICDVDSIQELIIPNKGIVNIEGLQYFTKLNRLDLTNNKIVDISPLRQLENLKILFVRENPIQDFSATAAFFNKLVQRDFEIKIEFFDSSLDTSVRVASGKIVGELLLDDIEKVTKLDISSKDIYDLKGIQLLFNLRELDLSKNNIRNIDSLKNLTQLRKLDLSFNQIENITPVSFLKNLEQLDLSNNKISDISILDKTPHLKSLSIAGNKISDISHLISLSNLKELDMRDNKIANLQALRGFNNLNSLLIKGNSISDYFPVIDYYNDLTKVDFYPGIKQRFYIDKPSYYLNDLEMQMDTVPVITQGRTFLPIRYVAENIGAKVNWDPEERKITISLDQKTIELWIDRNTAIVDGELVSIDVAPYILHERALIPVRFVVENLGLVINWDPDIREVSLFKLEIPKEFFLPLRNVAEKIGAMVTYEVEERKIIISLDQNTIELWVDKNTASVNEKLVTMSGAPYIFQESVFIPVRFIVENLGLDIDLKDI